MTGDDIETGQDSSEGGGKPCGECDPNLLDHLKCRAKGIQAQADYNKGHEQALTDARTQYDGARSAYSTAWKAAHPEVVDLRKQLAQIIDQLKCLVDSDRKIRLLDEAFWAVKHKLRECYPNEGCTFDDDCDFDDRVCGCEADEIASVIADIERRTAAAVAVFKDLIDEPAKLTKRVADLKTEVAAIVTKMASDPRTVNFVDLYAAALVARYHLETVWRGFEDVNAYMDCLCRALTCQIKGYAAVSELKGKEAVHQCHKDQKKAACEHLRDHTADEVIAEYLRRKAREHHEREESERGDEGRYGEREDDRGHGRDRDDDRDRDRGGDREPEGRYYNEERGRS